MTALNGNVKSVEWDSPENIRQVKNRVAFLTHGCNCKTGCTTCNVSASSLVVSVGQAVDVASARISLEKVCIQVLLIQLISRVEHFREFRHSDSAKSDNEYSKLFHTNCLE